MKTKRVMTTLVVVFFSMAALMAKDLKTVVFKVEQMNCENCVRRVNDNVKFAKGLTALTTDLSTKTVMVTYDAEKTTVADLQKAFGKINYSAVVVTDKAEAKKACSQEATQKDAKKDCCKQDAKKSGEGESCCGKKK